MKFFKYLLLFLTTVVILSGCGSRGMSESVTLLNQDKQEVTFPQKKPTLFFFITTYT